MMTASRPIAFVVKEIKEIIPPVLFFLVTFNLIELTTQLILHVYVTRTVNFMLATTAALLAGKAVLVANALPFLRRFDTAPAIRPILFKTTVYWVIAFVARFLEQVIEDLTGGGSLRGLPMYLAEHFSWHRFAAIQIWIFVLFFVYATIVEVNARLGDGELFNILFTRPAPGLGSAQQRVR